MKLSLKVEYACRVLAQMARSYGADQLTHIDSLAESEAIPKNYLVQILSELRNGGLIVSRRGKQGGYALVKAPEEISLLDVIRIVDAELLESRFSDTGQSGKRVAEVWGEISNAMVEKARGYTLRSFIPDEDSGMYFI